MIALNDLVKRVYRDKECIEFSYFVKDEKGETLFEAVYSKSLNGDGRTWYARIILDRTRDADSQIYGLGYTMPKTGLPLALIAATGLKYFQLYLREEIDRKVQYDFALGEVLKDM